MSTRPEPRLPVVVRFVALLAFETGLVAALHWLGRYDFLRIPWNDLRLWLRDTPAEDVLAAAIRQLALVLGYWLLASTLAYGFALLTRTPRLVQPISWALLPGARRVVDGVLALSITSGLLAVTHPAAPAGATAAQAPETEPSPTTGPPEATASQVAIYPQSVALPAPETGTRTYTVQAGDSLWEIAADQLGDPTRWVDIWHANRTRLDTAGATNPRPQIGWILVLPDALATVHQAAPAEPEPAETVTVEPGDNLWSLAEERLSDHLGAEPAPTETAPYWQQTIDANRAHLASGDPDLIYQGEEITLPAPNGSQPPPPQAAPQAPTVRPDPPPLTGGTDTEEPPAPPATGTPTTAPTTPTNTTSATTSTEPATTTTEPATPTTVEDAPPASTATSPTNPEPPPARPERTPEQDSPDGGIGEVLAPAAVTATLAALALRALARRRRARRRSARPGTTVAPRQAEDITTERALATASGDVLDRVRQTVHALAAPLGTLAEPPIITGIVVGPAGDTTVHLDGPAPAAVPFTEHPITPSAWLLPATHTDTPDSDDIETVPVLESVVTVGCTDGGEWVFLDLESLGAIWIDGQPDQAARLLRSISAELALQPLDHIVDLTVAGAISTPAITEQGVVTVDHLDEPMARRLERHATETAGYLAGEQADSTPVGRARGLLRDGLVVTVVAIDRGADPVLVGRVTEVALPGGRGLAVLALDALPEPAAQLVTDSDGTVHIPHLGLTVTAAGLDTDELHRIDDLLTREPDTVIPAPEPAPVVVAEQSGPPAKAAIDTTAVEDLEWEYLVRLFADHRVETSEGTPVSFRYGENPAVTNKNSSRGPELLTYLTFRPDRSATVAEIQDDLWWGRPINSRTVHNLISGTRSALGGDDYISRATGDIGRRRYTLAAVVVTDVELLGRALAHARATADREPSDALAALRPVLADIEAPAFRDGHLGRGLAEWAAAHRITDQVEQPLIEAALLAADIAIGQGPDGHADALWAIDRALRACPTNEALVRAAMQLHARTGDRDTANCRYIELATRLARDEIEPEPETTELRHQIMRANQQIG